LASWIKACFCASFDFFFYKRCGSRVEENDEPGKCEKFRSELVAELGRFEDDEGSG
jgi:hypothetical protein